MIEQTALLMKFYRGMPPLFLGLGPQWARIAAITLGTTGDTVNVSMLINAMLPPIRNDTVDTTPQVRARWADATRPMRTLADVPTVAPVQWLRSYSEAECRAGAGTDVFQAALRSSWS